MIDYTNLKWSQVMANWAMVGGFILALILMFMGIGVMVLGLVIESIPVQLSGLGITVILALMVYWTGEKLAEMEKDESID